MSGAAPAASLLCSITAIWACLARADDADTPEAQRPAHSDPQEIRAERAARREADLFASPRSSSGAETPPRATTPEEATSAAGSLQAGAPETRDAGPGDAVIRSLDRSLAWGGRFFLAGQYAFRETGNPFIHPLTSPSLVDLYLDARPSDRVRAYASSRLDVDLTVREDGVVPAPLARTATRLRLDQAWIKFDVDRRVFVTVGKERIRWGSGRLWNPTDFLNRLRLDPLDIFDRRLGVGLIKLHVPFEARGSNAYLLALYDEADALGRLGLAGRVELLLFNAELAASTVIREGTPLRVGLDLSSGLGPIDIRAEAAFSWNDARALRVVDDAGQARTLWLSPRDQWTVQAMGGVEWSHAYSDEGFLSVGVEYLYNAAGTDDASLYPWMFLQGLFQPLYVGRHYLAAFFALPGPGPWDDVNLSTSTLWNLSDGSLLTRVDGSLVVLTFLSWNLWAVAHYGNAGELRLPIELPPQPGVPGLEQGLSVAAPVFELGSALTLRF